MVSIVIPALNVESTISEIVRELHKSQYINQIIVVDNNSSDETAILAKNSDARVVSCKEQGMGCAIKEGIKYSKNNLIIKIDGDIRNPTQKWVNILCKNYDKNTGFLNA